jgi:hypothetical protein
MIASLLNDYRDSINNFFSAAEDKNKAKATLSLNELLVTIEKLENETGDDDEKLIIPDGLLESLHPKAKRYALLGILPAAESYIREAIK